MLLLMLGVLPGAWCQADPLSWLNGIRHAAGAQPLAADPLLSRTAAAWAAALCRAGVLSHRGSDGSTALDRYRSLGGSEVNVGEILGAGPRLGDVEEGWMRSSEHRSLVLARRWTHAGWGKGLARGKEVWVVLFCQKLVEGLQVDRDEGVLAIAGRFASAEAARPILLVGLEQVPPNAWDPVTRRFSFLVSAPSRGDYVRLGFGSTGGAFRLTNAFTLPPGTESPGDASRFSPPAPSP